MSLIEQPLHQAHAGLLLRSLIVGLSFPIVTLLSPGLPLNFVTAIRFLVALIALLPFIPWEEAVFKLSLPALGLYWLMGLCLAAFFGTMFWIAPRVSSVSMASLFVCVPLFTFLLSAVFRIERFNFKMLGLLLIGGLGALLLVRVEANSSEFYLGAEELAYLLGCGGMALYPVLSKWGLQRGWLVKNAAVRSAWGLLAGSISMAALGLILESPKDLGQMNFRDVLVLLYLGVFSSSLTFWLSQRAMLVLNPSEIVAYTYLVPLVSMLFLFVENPTLIGVDQLLGVVLVLFCTASLLNRNRAQKIVVT
tara:strand:- start:347 stop:1267 length:921 start_codon:yes stop_codon:yes gene_type:complete